jgi:tRNA pseudouridine55 synthase
MQMLTKSTFQNYDEWLSECATEGGMILIDKDAEWTSFDAVAKMRRIVNIKKIGHCGTLDPFATGLLIICIGRGATKQISSFQNLPKQYLATLKLGATTASFDTEKPEEFVSNISHLTKQQIEDTIHSFIGKQEQIPPMFSAKRFNGRRLYKFARKNREVEVEPVNIEIHSLQIVNADLPYITLLIDCSKGTYIRALARDIGEKLGVGAYLTSLRRTAIGEYKVDDAIRIEEMLERNTDA